MKNVKRRARSSRGSAPYTESKMSIVPKTPATKHLSLQENEGCACVSHVLFLFFGGRPLGKRGFVAECGLNLDVFYFHRV